MTPKEKAQEIFNAMHKIYDMSNYPNFTIDENDNQKNSELWENNNELFSIIYKQFAKESSLIAVDEILSLSKIASLRRNETEMELEFWQEVKQEIENL